MPTGPPEEENLDIYEEAIAVLNNANSAKVEEVEVEEEALSPPKKVAEGELPCKMRAHECG